MMKIMLISDDHGYDVFGEMYSLALEKYKKIDMIIHAGDTERFDKEYYEEISGVPVYLVKGNNDFGPVPNELLVKAEDKTIFVTHGHIYNVYSGLYKLAYAGKERNADIVVFGHTHMACHEKTPDTEYINPGSLAGVRSRMRSFAILTIDNGTINVEFESYKKN